MYKHIIKLSNQFPSKLKLQEIKIMIHELNKASHLNEYFSSWLGELLQMCFYH